MQLLTAIHVPTWSKTDLSNHPHFTRCLRTWIKKKRSSSKGDRKIESVYVNHQFSKFPCSSEHRPGPQGSPFPLAVFLPPTKAPTMSLAESYSVRVCVRINFLFYRGSSVCMYRSLFRFSLWEKSTEKKRRLCQFSWICMGTTSIVSGKLPYFLSKNIFWFTGKVQMQCLNQTEKHVISLFQSTKNPKTLQTIILSFQMFYFYSLTN